MITSQTRLNNVASEPLSLPISEIIVDLKFQMREEMNQQVVEDYAENMKQGGKFPPIRVFKIEDQYKVLDGFHRFEAKKKNGDTKIEAIVMQEI